MPEKQCSKCGATKDLNFFKKDRRRQYGRAPHCKECQRETDKKYRDDPRNAVKTTEYKEMYSRKYKGKYKETVKECVAIWHQRNQNAERAHSVVARAVKKGILPRVSTQPCSECGNTSSHYHHHNGYLPEHALDVVPMCRECHKETHVNSRTTNEKRRNL